MYAYSSNQGIPLRAPPTRNANARFFMNLLIFKFGKTAWKAYTMLVILI